MTNALEEKYKQELIDTIKKHVPKCKIYLYGSRATGKATAGSDIDLAIAAKEKLQFGVILDIKREIKNSTIPYFVDVVDLNSASQTFRDVIQDDMVLWSNG